MADRSNWTEQDWTAEQEAADNWLANEAAREHDEAIAFRMTNPHYDDADEAEFMRRNGLESMPF